MPPAPTPPPLPTSIVVGPFVYRVSTDKAERREVESTERTLLSGHTDHEALVILVDPAVAPAVLADTLLHETLHTITNITNLHDEIGHEREEGYVRRITPVLLELLRRNPTLVAYLTA